MLGISGHVAAGERWRRIACKRFRRGAVRGEGAGRIRPVDVWRGATAGTSIAMFPSVVVAARFDTPLLAFVETAVFGLLAVPVVIVPALATGRRRDIFGIPGPTPSHRPLWQATPSVTRSLPQPRHMRGTPPASDACSPCWGVSSVRVPGRTQRTETHELVDAPTPR